MLHLNVLMDGTSLTNSGTELQMLGDEWQKACWPIVRLARGTVLLREVDYWITMTEKVGKERVVHEGMPDGQKTD